MSDQLFLQILQTLPAIIWALLAVIVVARLYGPIKDDVIPRMTGVKVMGFQLDLKADEVQRAVEEVKKEGVVYPLSTGAVLVGRAERTASILRDGSILWIDGHTLNNLVERRLMTRLGIHAEPVTSTDEALRAITAAKAHSGLSMSLSRT